MSLTQERIPHVELSNKVCDLHMTKSLGQEISQHVIHGAVVNMNVTMAKTLMQVAKLDPIVLHSTVVHPIQGSDNHQQALVVVVEHDGMVQLADEGGHETM